MMRAMKVVANVPTIKARAPKLAALPSPGAGIHRELVKNCHQSSFRTMGPASLKMNRKMAAMPMMLLQPQRRMIHSVGFSVASKKLNFRRRAWELGFGLEPGMSDLVHVAKSRFARREPRRSGG